MLSVGQLQDAIGEAVSTARRALPATDRHGEAIEYNITYSAAEDAWSIFAVGAKSRWFVNRTRTYLTDATRAIVDLIEREQNHQHNPENQIPFSRLHP